MSVRRVSFTTGALCALAAATLASGVLAPTAALADTCPNAAYRIGTPSANLPDCRAYEMVTPLDKNFSDAQTAMASMDGEKVAFFTGAGGFGDVRGTPDKTLYVAARGSQGWVVKGGSPPEESTDTFSLAPGAISPDITSFVYQTNSDLVPGAYHENLNYSGMFFEDLASGIFTDLAPEVPSDAGAPHGLANESAIVGSNNFSRIAFEAVGSYTAEPRYTVNSYEWSEGQLRSLNELPGEVHDPKGVVIGGGTPNNAGARRGAVSADGQYVFFTTATTRQLYVRKHGSETVEASAPQGGSGSGTQPAEFMGATGSMALFTSGEALTPDAKPLGEELYEYDASTGQLKDLSVDPKTTGVVGTFVDGVVNYSSDGQYVYFIGLNQLLPGKGELGAPNLYLSHNGQISYVTTLSPSDSLDWHFDASANTSRVSADGSVLVFESVLPLAGAETSGHRETYRYDLNSDEITCVSCNPNGTAPTSDSSLANAIMDGAFKQPRNLSEDGRRVFFDTRDALVPQDTNGQIDVYEWEQGQIHLISSGRGEGESTFQDASPNGNDVVFLTRDHLVGQDADPIVDVYDARVGGGYPPPPEKPEPCTDEACHPARTLPPVLPTPGTVDFNGPGNLIGSAESAAKRHKAPHKPKKAKKHKRRHKQNKAHKSLSKRPRH